MFVTEEVFARQTLFHEISHGLGPISVRNENKISLQKALKECYSPIEEAKADVVGLFVASYFSSNGILEEDDLIKHFVTQIASIFRSVRFSVASAHAKADLIQMSYFYENKAVYFKDNEDKFVIDVDKMKVRSRKSIKRIIDHRSTWRL